MGCLECRGFKRDQNNTKLSEHLSGDLHYLANYKPNFTDGNFFPSSKCRQVNFAKALAIRQLALHITTFCELQNRALFHS